MYLQIARYLEGIIEKGNLKPGDSIGTVKELVEQYGVSRVTVSKAIKHLADKNILVSRQGKGTFVAQPQEDKIAENTATADKSTKALLKSQQESKNLCIENMEHLLAGKGIHPKYAMQFPVMLPFFLPFPERYIINIDHQKNPMVLCFRSKSSNSTLSQNPQHSKPVQIPHLATLVEMYYVNTKSLKLPPDDHYLNIVFDELIRALNLVIAAYTIHSRDLKIHRITRADLEVSCIYNIINMSRRKAIYSDLFLINKNIPYNKTELTKEDCEQIGGYLNALQENSNPFLFSKEIMLYSARYFNRGHYIESVIFAQISVESFIKNVYTLLLKEKGKKTAKNKPLNLFKIINEEFKHYFNLDTEEDHPVVAFNAWYKFTYRLLQNTISTGYPPNITEADTAISKAHELITYINTLISRSKSDYPCLYELVNH